MWIIRELNLLSFFMENLSFSLKLSLGYFYGQSFIKTVRGPFNVTMMGQWYLIRSGNNGELTPLYKYTTLSGLLNIVISRRDEEFSV